MKGLGYYEAVAQVIPILLLVVAVEARFLTPRHYPESLKEWSFEALNVLLFLVVIVAEFSALEVLKEERTTEWRDQLIESALILEVGWITALALDLPAQRKHRMKRQKKPHR
jgi:hypothetical protein